MEGHERINARIGMQESLDKQMHREKKSNPGHYSGPIQQFGRMKDADVSCPPPPQILDPIADLSWDDSKGTCFAVPNPYELAPPGGQLPICFMLVKSAVMVP